MQFDNHLRSACVETNATGEVISYEEFHPYGTTAYHAGLGVLDANPKRYRYSGKERDAESGLYCYGARYLAPWLGRWVSPDPAGFVDGVNVYAFVRGRPSTGWDEDGRQQSAAPAEKDSQAFLTGFDVGSASLDPVRYHYNILLERARNSDERIYIVGQASPTRSQSYNIRLSNDRAMTVFDELVKDGIDPTRLAVMPVGESVARERGVPDGEEDVYARQVVVHFGSAPTACVPIISEPTEDVEPSTAIPQNTDDFDYVEPLDELFVRFGGQTSHTALWVTIGVRLEVEYASESGLDIRLQTASSIAEVQSLGDMVTNFAGWDIGGAAYAEAGLLGAPKDERNQSAIPVFLLERLFSRQATNRGTSFLGTFTDSETSLGMSYGRGVGMSWGTTTWVDRLSLRRP